MADRRPTNFGSYDHVWAARMMVSPPSERPDLSAGILAAAYVMRSWRRAWDRGVFDAAPTVCHEAFHPYGDDRAADPLTWDVPR